MLAGVAATAAAVVSAGRMIPMHTHIIYYYIISFPGSLVVIYIIVLYLHIILCVARGIYVSVVVKTFAANPSLGS